MGRSGPCAVSVRGGGVAQPGARGVPPRPPSPIRPSGTTARGRGGGSAPQGRGELRDQPPTGRTRRTTTRGTPSAAGTTLKPRLSERGRLRPPSPTLGFARAGGTPIAPSGTTARSRRHPAARRQPKKTPTSS
ncbi:hypothetical protein E7X38_07445 [Streptomyces sp. Akac8]|nr:hypothetical protein E7X38_07445 [Streptomyces sp. Akac8]